MHYYSQNEVRGLCLSPSRYSNATEKDIRDHCVIKTASWFKHTYLKLYFKELRDWYQFKHKYPTVTVDESTGDIYASLGGISTHVPYNYLEELSYHRG